MDVAWFCCSNGILQRIKYGLIIKNAMSNIVVTAVKAATSRNRTDQKNIVTEIKEKALLHLHLPE